MTEKGFIYSIGYNGKPINFEYEILSSYEGCDDNMDWYGEVKVGISDTEIYQGTILLSPATSVNLGLHYTICSLTSTTPSGYVSSTSSFTHKVSFTPDITNLNCRSNDSTTTAIVFDCENMDGGVGISSSSTKRDSRGFTTKIWVKGN